VVGKADTSRHNYIVNTYNRTIGVRELSNNVSTFLKLAATGQNLLITKNGKPLARLGPAEAEAQERAESRGLTLQEWAQQRYAQ
jgi:prevent-host-death family protein